MADSASDADFLVLVVRLVQTDATVCQSKVQLDLNPLAWHHTPLALHDALDHILVFLNAHLALRDGNQLAVYACSITSSRLLYSSLTPAADAGPDRDANTYAPFRRLDHRIAEGVKDVVRDLDETLDHGQTGLVNALSRALAHINKQRQLTEAKMLPKPRILILSATTDTSGQYVRIMNCIFSAQKSGLPIDVCKVYGPDSVFLQQAAHLTSGAYLRLEHPRALLQYLMTAYLPSRSIRKHLNLPTQETVDLRAACFCHRKIIDLGYVCSVCLSIFCRPIERCTTCKTQFSVSSSPKKRLTSNLRNEVTAPVNGAAHEAAQPMETD